MWNSWSLFAQTTPAAAPAGGEGAAAAAPDAVTSTFEFGRLAAMSGWEWVALVAVVGVIGFLVIFFYIRDCVEHGKGLAVTLILFRVAAFGGLLWIFLQPQYRRTHEEVVTSKVILIADTSLSMNKVDENAAQRRIDEVIAALRDGTLIPELREVHEVVVYRFDTDLGLIRGYPKIDPDAPDGSEATLVNAPTQGNDADAPDAASGEQAGSQKPVDWAAALEPSGRETRLGQSLRQIVSEERASPVSGIVVITDGRNNAGAGHEAAVKLAEDLGFPIHTVGIGSALPAVSAQLTDFSVPARAFPRDKFAVTAYVNSSGVEGVSGTLEIRRRAAGAEASEADTVASRQVVFGKDGEVLSETFEIDSAAPGKFTFEARLLASDPRLARVADAKLHNEKQIEIVDYKTRILLFAGGPTRDYRFVRNQLNRDRTMIVDVCLQNARAGISQDANAILDDFPTDKLELYEYDTIVAFDPDWRSLSENQIELLRDWVAEEAGGLIVIPGPVFTDLWVQSARSTNAATKYSMIQALYPVRFPQTISLLNRSQNDNSMAWPIQFTPAGEAAEFLWLDDTPVASQTAWIMFEGVFEFYDVLGPKPGATVFGHYSDPGAGAGSELPVYLASQFYGSGRVFYLGSGETWRLRKVGVGYFEALWTKLARHVSQGRLLRGSQRATLLMERDKFQLGEAVKVRAKLKDANLDPETRDNVGLRVTTPSADIINLVLTAVSDTTTGPDAGMYAGEFSAYEEGTYSLRLDVPDSSEDVAERTIDVKLPQLESENTQRNDALLTEISRRTGGTMFTGMDQALDRAADDSLYTVLPNAERTLILSDRPQSLWDNQWTLFAIVGILCMEWLIRRLVKLA